MLTRKARGFRVGGTAGLLCVMGTFGALGHDQSIPPVNEAARARSCNGACGVDRGHSVGQSVCASGNQRDCSQTEARQAGIPSASNCLRRHAAEDRGFECERAGGGGRVAPLT